MFHYDTGSENSLGASPERRPVINAVDLCAPPGSWSQVLQQKLLANNSRAVVVSVDLQELAPIQGVVSLQGDISRQETLEKVSQYFVEGKCIC